VYINLEYKVPVTNMQFIKIITIFSVSCSLEVRVLANKV